MRNIIIQGETTPSITLVLALHAHELAERPAIVTTLMELARAHGYKGDVQIAPRLVRSSKLQVGTVIVVPDLARLGHTPLDVLKVIAWLMAKDCTILGADGTTLLSGTESYAKLGIFIDTILSVGRVTRSRRTRESFFLARQRGEHLGRTPIGADVVEAVQQAYAKIGTSRGAARLVQAAGYTVSRSSVQKILAQAKKVKS